MAYKRTMEQFLFRLLRYKPTVVIQLHYNIVGLFSKKSELTVTCDSKNWASLQKHFGSHFLNRVHLKATKHYTIYLKRCFSVLGHSQNQGHFWGHLQPGTDLQKWVRLVTVAFGPAPLGTLTVGA